MNYVYKVFYPILAVLIVGVIVLVAFAIVQDMQKESPVDNSIPQGSDTIEDSDRNDSIAPMFTRDQVSQANDIEDYCLTIVENSVYQIPESWAKQHEGGYEQIASMCGKDSTTDFTAQHKDDNTAKDQLADFFVGTIKLENVLDQSLKVSVIQRDLVRKDKVNAINLWLATYYTDVARYPATNEISFDSEGVKLNGDNVNLITEFSDYTMPGEVTNSKQTVYCYESDEVSYKLGVMLEDGTNLQLGNTGESCLFL
ncbi:cytochrome b5 domain-containing protein [Candidatus Dojkabacteria bacterium]|uniref:Cytochrome b5 domain-containing protein n=1 Tax=Candidatus Dojkabacteria bacterium TaxID=2099670 RepID=A0A955L9K7_9BACT|nr:cytochrome b5 domain-containing protein [Candidatus Dojkabacteria bacterium]